MIKYRTIILIFLIVQTMICFRGNALEVTTLRCEYKENPLGVSETSPRLSWVLRSDVNNKVQSAYRIIVSSSIDRLQQENGDLWDSGKVLSNRTNQIGYLGKSLVSRDKCYWKVRVWDGHDQPSKWSEPAEWTMGLLEMWDWQGYWIGYETEDYNKEDDLDLPPSPYLVKPFEAKGEIRQAILYVTALGVYEARINGNRVGNDYLSPGWTDYHKRVHYQMYDVTELMQEGDNVIGAILSEGWYAGYVGFGKLNKSIQEKYFYGKVPCLLAQLEIQYKSGDKQIISTDESWRASIGAILESDIQMGVTYDARKELTGWDSPGYNYSNWQRVTLYPGSLAPRLAHPGEPIQITDTILPLSISERPIGTFIYDMGQNFAGVVKLKVTGERGTKITLRFGEMLHLDGSLMTENLRCARVIDTYILSGDPEGEEWLPNFTFHGFQFVEIIGYPGKPGLDAITGYAFSSATKPSANFNCSSPMVNKLYENIVWTQKANFIDIPTDCPQRDERLGWTGDAQVYVKSSTINMDVASFFNKWLADLNDAQRHDGPYPNFAPSPYSRVKHDYSPGWSEAGIIVPYEIYMAYDDTRMIERYYKNMQKKLDFYVRKAAGRYYFPENSFTDIRPIGGWGDWLAIGSQTPKDLIATFYFAYSAKLMAEMAKAINKTDDYLEYRNLFEKICAAFIEHCMDADGRIIDGHTQTSYANAIYIGMLPPDLEKKAGEYLITLLDENGGRLSTGFLGVKQLLPALSKTNHSSYAYNLILEEGYPSWGYEVVNGATSIWERWNSFTKEDGFASTAMNSFSHYAFGSVCEWMFANMAGIQTAGAGYREIILKPEIVEEKINYVNASYHSINGEIHSNWNVNNGNFKWDVHIPVNTTATIHIPASGLSSIRIDGNRLAENKQIKILDVSDGYVIIESGSGNYSFTSLLK